MNIDLLRRNPLSSFALLLVLITPCIPKIGVSEQVTLFPLDALLLCAFPFFIQDKILDAQRSLYWIWGLILFSTLLSQLFDFNVSSILRCLKEIVYIPLLCIAVKCKWLHWRHISCFFIISACVNLIYVAIVGFSFSSLDIWNVDTMFSGLSNKYLNLGSMNVIQMEGKGSHGVYSDYCALATLCTIVAYERKEIGISFLVAVVALAIVCIGMSVSREGFIVMAMMLLSYFYAKISGTRIKIRLWHLFLMTLLLGSVFFVVFKYADNIAVIQKILYTKDRLSTTGTESNIALRISGWMVYLESIIRNPLMIITGYGYNFDYYRSFLTFHRGSSFAGIPESYFVECILCGGIFALYFGIKFWYSMYEIFSSAKNRSVKFASIGLFVGLLIGGLFSGAAIFADLLYCHILIVLGLLLRERSENLKRMIIIRKLINTCYYIDCNEKNIAHNCSK